MKTNVDKKVKVGIVGASGYSGEELVRLLLAHPHVESTAVTSRQYAGQTLAPGISQIRQSSARQNICASPNPTPSLLAKAAQVVFLALPHGVAAEFAVPCSSRAARSST